MLKMPIGYDPYADVRKIGVNVDFELVDANATWGNVNPSFTRAAFFCSPAQIYNGVPRFSRKYATIEPNGWILDGSYSLVSENRAENGEIGYWMRDMADIEGILPNRYLTARFFSPVSMPGITIYFDERANVFPKEVTYRITYTGGSFSETVTVQNDGPVCFIPAENENVAQVRFSFNKMNIPNGILRVADIVFGKIQEFTGNQIEGVSCVYGSSTYGESFPSAQAVIDINNVARAYDIVSPVGFWKYMQRGQGLNVNIVINGEIVNMGRLYFDSVESVDNGMIARITAVDRAIALERVVFDKGETGQTRLSDLVAQVLNTARVYSNPKYPDNDFGAQMINRCIPINTTCREAIRMIAQAAKSICYFSRDDELVFLPTSKSEAVDMVDYNRMDSYPTVTDGGLINRIELTVRDEFSQTETVYVSENIGSGESVNTLAVANPLVSNGQDVADWLLEMMSYRFTFDISERGNPAREIGDVVTIKEERVPFIMRSSDVRVISEEFTVKDGLTGRFTGVMNGAV